ncbi:MAG: hypothetical protein JWN63_818 [Candidatus Acidoferrum typicum]|nr:hypothetical protein [Candidatus Acidoferrum typicum]
MLLVVVATTSHARDIKAEFLQWCGKTTLGEFAADNAANAGSDAPAGSVYFPPQAGLTFAGKPLQAVLIKEGTRTSPDIYGVTIQGPARSVTARLTGAGHKARTRTSAFSPGATLGARCVGWYAVTSDLRDDGHWGRVSVGDRGDGRQRVEQQLHRGRLRVRVRLLGRAARLP